MGFEMEVEGAVHHREKQGSTADALDAALQNLLQVRNLIVLLVEYLNALQRCVVHFFEMHRGVLMHFGIGIT